MKDLHFEPLDRVPLGGELVPLAALTVEQQVDAVLDEANEAKTAEQALRNCEHGPAHIRAILRHDLLMELADMMQAAYDAFVLMGEDPQKWVDAVRAKNAARERYA
jgi:predicted HAD superfamily Cof-like phosphohydrolase